MPTESCQLEFVVSTSPESLFSSWISSEGHTAMTGAKADFSGEDGAFTAWEGYIQGRNVELHSPHRIVQEWRTLDFPESSRASRVEIQFSQVEGGTKVSISHTDIPEGQGAKYDEGWVTHYVEPIGKHYGEG